ncbi:unnamed protein product [Bursaphelenchus okinawaensis]|uniref:LRRCT domain-containing protein n=1 Tax=Bursaphelenchus okinawaensis TaxID=465554 RepID=A0A811JVK9_9BILA|nr:unnamed protein product [Bursaphelenchus okinawaensis]CAG9084593.1 unnamed protein product [Bursaphelenchus okinawaensis]
MFFLINTDNSTDISHIQCICLKDVDKTSYLVHCPFETEITFLNQVLNEINDINHTVSSIVVTNLKKSNDTNVTFWEAITTAATEELEELTIRHCSEDIRLAILNDTPVHSLKSVLQLKIENCRLGRIPSLFLQGLSGLSYLSLKDNNIEKLLKDDFKGLDKLTTLDISENIINNVKDNSLSTLPQLETLYVGNHNNITESFKHEISRLPSLKQISLAKADEVYNLDDFKFSEGSKLERADLSGCGLTELKKDDLKHLESLEYLDLSVNLIEKIDSNSFSPTKNLQYLSLAGNFLNETNLNTDSWTGLDSLINLDLGYNEFTGFENSFKHLGNLKTLNLRSNSRLFRLESNAFDGLKSLEDLNLTACSIKHIDDKAFDGMENIKTLDLSFNKLYQLETPFKVIGSGLNNLNLSSNRLTFINASTFSDLHNLTILDISQNPFVCNYKVLELQKWINEEYIRATKDSRPFYLAKPEQVACEEPAHLKGRELMEITIDMINNVPETTFTPPSTTESDELTTMGFDLSKWSAHIGEGNDTLFKEESDADKPTYDINSIKYGQRQTKTQTQTTWVTISSVAFLVLVTIIGVIYVVRRKKTNLVSEHSISQGISSSL